MPKNIKLQDSEFNITSSGGNVEFNVAGNATISGNLTVNGTTTTVNTTNLEIADNVIVLNKNETGDGISVGTGNTVGIGRHAGIEVERGTLTNVSILYDEDQDYWALTNTGTPGEWYEIFNRNTLDINALTLGNLERSAYAVKAENEIITGNYTFDQGANSFINIRSTDTSLVKFTSDSTGSIRTKFELGTNLANDFQVKKYIDATGIFDKNILTVSMADSVITLDTPQLTQVTGNNMRISAGPANPASPGNDIIIAPSEGDTGLEAGKVILGLTSTSATRVQAENEMHLESPAPIKILASGSTATDLSDGQIELGSIISPDDMPLTITAGASSTTNGADLILQGGPSTAGANGNVVIGALQVTSTGIDVALETTGTLTLDSDAGEIILINGAGPGYLTGESKQTLTVSGGDSLDADNGGDLVLKGGTSALGTNGTVYINSDVVISGSTVLSGPTTTPYQIQFFAPTVIMTGLNPSITLDSKAMAYDVNILSTGHIGYAESPPTNSNTTYILNRIRSGVTTQIGTALFLQNTNAASVISITQLTLLTGDIVRLVNPLSPDAGVGNVTITLKANIV